MITEVVQHWRKRRAFFLAKGGFIRPADFEVVPIPRTMAERFVVEHHYAGSMSAGVRRSFGLFHHAEHVGTAVFNRSIHDNVLLGLPGGTDLAVELGRFVLLNRIGSNAETFFLAPCFAALAREGFLAVVSHSDPVPRVDAAGQLVMPGHVGTIYQAFNGVYQGRTTARTLYILPDGTVFSARTAQKIRARERGWEPAVETLVAAGAAPLGTEDPRVWLRRELRRVARLVRHPGNHRYAWTLGRARRGAMLIPSRDPYPKFTPGQFPSEPEAVVVDAA